ncbi:hypothetical protein ACOME3_002562 [Neoechinorhynchus agilis]
MAATRRLQKELAELQLVRQQNLHSVQIDGDDILTWNLLLLPDNAPYNKGAFRVQMSFPCEYPFKPPRIIFKTPIYHVNIDEHGQVCLPIIMSENWKPATRADQVIQTLIAMVNDPQPDHPLRSDLAELFNRDRRAFYKRAEEFTTQFAEKRPC